MRAESGSNETFEKTKRRQHRKHHQGEGGGEAIVLHLTPDLGAGITDTVNKLWQTFQPPREWACLGETSYGEYLL